MNMYQEFVKAVNESGNERVKISGRALIGTCQKYYSAYMQYQNLDSINKWVSQIYNTKEEIDKKELAMEVKPGKLSVSDRQMLAFLVEYKKILSRAECEKRKEIINTKKKKLEESRTDAERRDQLKDEIAEHEEKINQLEKTTLDCLLYYTNRENANTIIQELMDGAAQSYPQLKMMMRNAVSAYKKILDSRLGHSAESVREYRSVIRQSDIKLDKIDEMAAEYVKNKVTVNSSSEEAFNYLLKEEYVSELIAIVHNYSDEVWAAHLSYAISPLLSRLTYKEIKRESSDYYLEKNFRFSLEKLQEMIKFMIKNFGVVFDSYIQNKQNLKEILAYGEIAANRYAEELEE